MKSNPPSPRTRLAVIAAALVPLGFGTKVYSGPGSAWVTGHAGGFLYVVFWSLLILAVRPDLSAGAVALGVLLVTSAVEFLQLWHPPLLEAARRTFVGQALLGSYFSWSDFPYYVAGAACAAVIGRHLQGRDPRADTPPSG